MIDSNIYNEIYNEIVKMPVIDTHEHLPWQEEQSYNDGRDVLQEYLRHYLKCDLISAGLKRNDFERVMDSNSSILERWNIVEPFWEVSRYTGYGRVLDIAVKAIYGIDGINRNTIEELNNTFIKNKAPGHFEYVLKDLCNIHTSLLDIWTFRLEGENPLFRRIWQPQNFINPMSPYEHDMLSYIETHYSINVRSLDDWLEALERELDYMLAAYGVSVLKSCIAYFRSLRFEKVEYKTARDLFALTLDKWNNEGRNKGLGLELPREVQDFMMHYILGLANKRNLIFQFHTGLQEGNGNIITNSDPSLMINLFMEYPDVNFDLFHISYPYQGIASALCKNFPNVFIDMCWAHIMSPSACVQALDVFLDAIPYNKISAFGGDYMFVDGVYGHLYIARQNVSKVLATKVEQGIFDEGKAIEIARALFFDNPKRIFKL